MGAVRRGVPVLVHGGEGDALCACKRLGGQAQGTGHCVLNVCTCHEDEDLRFTPCLEQGVQDEGSWLILTLGMRAP